MHEINRTRDDDPPLADTTAKNLLTMRTRARNARFSKLPNLPEEQVPWAERLLAASRLDIAKLLEVPSYGPSFLALWADAKTQGLSDTDAVVYIWKWAKAWPAAWERDDRRKARDLPLIHPEVTRRLQHVTAWRQTGDLDYPWEADVKSARWQVRLNDFPDDYMYTLLVRGKVVGDFHDWPEAWDRGDGNAGAETKAPLVLRETPDIDPAALLSRYENGEHEAVWRDLTSLGADVRQPRYREPARAVARETMRRARRNVERLRERLQELDYVFYSDAADILRFCSQEEEGAVEGAEGDGLWLPLSVHAWVREVGSVDFTGSHPTLSLMDDDDGKPGVYADPLAMSYWNLVDISEAWRKRKIADRKPMTLELGPDAPSKSRLQAGWEVSGVYSVSIPNQFCDAVLEGEPHGLTLVEYLRLSFRWGGFPGWERYDHRPEKDLAFLREGLLPI
jgi:hypothetical protein